MRIAKVSFCIIFSSILSVVHSDTVYTLPSLICLLLFRIVTGEKRELTVLHRLHLKGNRTIDPQCGSWQISLELLLIVSSTVCNGVLSVTDHARYFSCQGQAK